MIDHPTLTYQEMLERFRWRPIKELHEDYGPCVLINLDDPGYLEIGSNLDTDFDESLWTHFTQITPLSHEEAEKLMEEMKRGNVPEEPPTSTNRIVKARIVRRTERPVFGLDEE